MNHKNKPIKPIQEIPEREKWLFEPENKDLLERLKKGLQQKGTVDLGSFSQYLESDASKQNPKK